MKSFVAAIFFVVGTSLLIAQDSAALEALYSNGLKQQATHAATGSVRSLYFGPADALDLPGADAVEKTAQFLQRYGSLWESVAQQRSQQLVSGSYRDAYGLTHVAVQQYFDGVPVFDGVMRFHFDEDLRLYSVNGIFLPGMTGATLATVDAQTAQATARASWLKTYGRAVGHLDATSTELVVFHPGLPVGQPAAARLAYAITLEDEWHQRDYFFIDARSGNLLAHYPGQCTLHRRVYQGSTSTLVWNEGDAYPGSLSAEQQNIVVVSGQTFHFFNNTFGFQSFDNQDGIMQGVSAATTLSCPNANWNGSSANFCTGLAVDDVIAHEWGHAYTEYTNNLLYAWQSGAINEAYSDIWGEVVDLLNAYGSDTDHNVLRTSCSNSIRWKMGEQSSTGALRDMWDPTCASDPGKVSDGQYFCSTSDNGGVHTNSGVVNHLFALLVDGGTYNGYTIPGLGLTKTVHIFWSAAASYLGRTSDFAALADALEAAAAGLQGGNLQGISLTSTPAGPSGIMISAADVIAVEDAILAVELREAPSCVNFGPVLAQSPPDLCTNPGESLQTIVSEDFEAGATGWTATEIPTVPATWDARSWQLWPDLPEARAGQGMFASNPYVGNCASDLDNGIMRLQSPNINIPAAATGGLYLTFDHYFSLETAWDGGNLKLQRNGGAWNLIGSSAFVYNAYNRTLNSAGSGNDNPLAGQASFSGSDTGSASGTWGTSQINLSALGVVPGDQIALRWELGSDGCNGWDGWYLDEVVVGVCATAALPVEWLSFTAERNAKQGVVLQWATAPAPHNKGFYLERSTDGLHFESIAWIAAKHAEQDNPNYAYEDLTADPAKGHFYRLRQEDVDGTTSYSTIRYLAALLDKPVITLSPNPASGDAVRLTNNSPRPTEATVQLTNAQGMPIGASQRWEEGIFTLDIRRIPPGMYYLLIRDEAGTEVVKLVRQ